MNRAAREPHWVGDPERLCIIRWLYGCALYVFARVRHVGTVEIKNA